MLSSVWDALTWYEAIPSVANQIPIP